MCLPFPTGPFSQAETANTESGAGKPLKRGKEVGKVSLVADLSDMGCRSARGNGGAFVTRLREAAVAVRTDFARADEVL